jgi:hypothetical protein
MLYCKCPEVGGPQINSANRKSANLRTYFFNICKTFATVSNLLICALWTIHLLLFANPRTTLGFWDSFELHGLRTVGKNSIGGNGSGSETLPLSLQICGFAICGLGHQGNLRICDLLIIHYKFANLRFADWHTSEICNLRTSNKNLRCPPLAMPCSNILASRLEYCTESSPCRKFPV